MHTHTHKVRSGLCFTPIKPKFSHTGGGGLGSGMGTLGLGSFNTSPKSLLCPAAELGVKHSCARSPRLSGASSGHTGFLAWFLCEGKI